MRIFHIDPSQNEEVKAFHSQGAYLSPIVEVLAGAAIQWLWFDPHSHMGLHKTESPLIYIVVEGTGWVITEQIEPMEISCQDYVFWDIGDWCELGTDDGMQVIAIESCLPEPNVFKVS
jgi:hypothetical protein